jgi:hypothetical protein
MRSILIDQAGTSERSSWMWLCCRLACLSLSLVILAGCSTGAPAPPSGVTVVGKIVKGGQPLQAERLPPGEFIGEVTFVPLATGGSREQEPLKVDGSFQEAGLGKGIAPGKYRVAVLHFIRGRGTDGLAGAFSEQASPITIDVPTDKIGGTFDVQTIELDDFKSK